MRLHAYSCPECGGRNRTCEGVKHADGWLSVLCRFCNNVEWIPPVYANSDGGREVARV